MMAVPTFGHESGTNKLLPPPLGQPIVMLATSRRYTPRPEANSLTPEATIETAVPSLASLSLTEKHFAASPVAVVGSKCFRLDADFYGWNKHRSNRKNGIQVRVK